MLAQLDFVSAMNWFFNTMAFPAGISAACLFILRSWFVGNLKNDFDKRLETHKGELSAQNAQALESLKAQFQIAAETHRVKFQSYHEKTADTLAVAYGNLVDAKVAIERYISPHVDPDKFPELRQAIGEALGKFFDHFSRNQIYVSKELAVEIESFRDVLHKTAHDFMIRVDYPMKRGKDDDEAWTRALAECDGPIPDILESLTDEIRSVLNA